VIAWVGDQIDRCLQCYQDIASALQQTAKKQ
jgi:hypothetical protein